MLTRPLNDFRCLTLILYVVLERLGDAAIRGWAESFGSLPAYVSDLRSRPQIDDMPGVLMDAPRVACVPPQRLRFNAKDPACCERSADYLTVAEVLDPGTPRTLITIRVGGQMHVLPVERRPDGATPIILDPIAQETPGVPENLSFAAVARLLGYGPGQPTPMYEPLAWAEQLAAREGVQPRNSRDLLAVVERYANVYPGGRQGLADLAGQIVQPVVDAGKGAARAGARVVQEGAREVKKRPELGQLLRSAIVGYGGPFAVFAIDVVENRLNKRGYTLGSLARSRDVDVFAFH